MKYLAKIKVGNEMLTTDEIRRRCRNGIMNTATGQYLYAALHECDRLYNYASKCLSESMDLADRLRRAMHPGEDWSGWEQDELGYSGGKSESTGGKSATVLTPNNNPLHATGKDDSVQRKVGAEPESGVVA